MAKRETRETYQDTKKQAAQTSAQYNAAQGEAKERSAAQGQTVGDQRTALTGGYNSMMQPAGTLQARSISFDPMGNPRDINVSELRDTLGGYKGFRDTGGLSTENVNRMRGLGGFDEFARTGGYTPESIANIKAQALSPISSYATGTRDELNRRAALTGGYAPGFDAANRQLQRDTARNIADTSLAANVGIQDRINQGRQWGIGGIAQTESGLAGMQTGNRLAALGGEGNIGQALSSFDARNIENEMQAEMFNKQMQDSVARFNAGMATEADLFNIQNAQHSRAQGMAGLQGLYNTDVGQYQNELDRRNALLGGQTQANLGYLNNQSQLAVQPGIGGNVMGAIGAGAGIASQYFAARPR
jgi:hypothetical protein